MPAQDPSNLVAAVPAWWPEALFWLGIGLFVAVLLTAAGVWTLVQRVAALREDARALDALGSIQRTLERLAAARDDLDLRRIEHLLIDLRDGARRLEETLLRVQEQRPIESDALVPLSDPGLGERVINRLLALGYERVELVARGEDLRAMARADGELLVEARREGVLCKGKVLIRGGRIDAVHIEPAFPVFP